MTAESLDPAAFAPVRSTLVDLCGRLIAVTAIWGDRDELLMLIGSLAVEVCQIDDAAAKIVEKSREIDALAGKLPWGPQ
jgi:hypothetical protein